MRPPRRAASRRSALLRTTKETSEALLKMTTLLGLLRKLGHVPKKLRNRGKLLPRQRRSWEEYIRPMRGDTFRNRFRMEHTDFIVLVGMLRPKLQRDAKMGALRNGAIPVEYQVARALRWLAGGSVYECMDGHVIARSTAYAVVHDVIDALNEAPELVCAWPQDGAVDEGAAAFKRRSTNDVITHACGGVDGLFLHIRQPSTQEHKHPLQFYSGHKKGFGYNFQGICNANYELIAWAMNCPGSQNDRTAFNGSGFENLLRQLPEAFYILGDAAYHASDRVLVPYPGTKLTVSQDSYNFYHSECRISVEETFGIMVRTWGILWRPCEVSHDRFTHVMNSVVRLHNFCRRRRVRVPARNVGDVGEPPVRFSRNNTMIGNYYDTVRNDRVWRPASNQAGLPQTREAIRTRLEIEGIMRPRVDIDRNARGGGGPFPGAEEGGGYCA